MATDEGTTTTAASEPRSASGLVIEGEADVCPYQPLGPTRGLWLTFINTCLLAAIVICVWQGWLGASKKPPPEMVTVNNLSNNTTSSAWCDEPWKLENEWVICEEPRYKEMSNGQTVSRLIYRVPNLSIVTLYREERHTP